MNYSAYPDLKFSGFRFTLATAAFVGTCAFAVIPAQAQNMQAIESTTVGAQAQYNNTWGQSFEVTGPNLGGGKYGVISPFANTEKMSYSTMKERGRRPQPIKTSPLLVPNSGVATFSASVTKMSPKGGNLSGQAQILQGSTSNNIVLNQNSQEGVPSITVNPYQDEHGIAHESTIGANILGTNIGASSVQVTGTNSYTVMNEISAF